MKKFKKAEDLRTFLSLQGKEARTGFVPTMGALHPGHLSLIHKSREENHQTVCSIFVNPTQFNQKEDFEKYPRTVEKDIELLESVGCEVVFVPEVEEIYPEGLHYNPYPVHLGHLGKILEAEFRPGHFEGVLQVVGRLFEIVRPHKAYFGSKDYQQYKVVECLTKFHFPDVTLCLMPTVREPDGLAMSSRNQRLSPEGRKKALHIYYALQEATERFARGENPADIEKIIRIKYFDSNGLKCDYFSFCSPDNLSPTHPQDSRTLILAAVWVDGVRLIDNMESKRK